MNRFTKLINSVKINNNNLTLLEELKNKNKIVKYNRPTDIVLYKNLTIIKPYNKVIKIKLLINKII